jgi:LmbE family N-acetylglucosaminyl deacetylase
VLNLNLATNINRVLCLGAHSDDIEIGCGGTILKLIERNPKLEFSWVVFSGDTERAREARASAERFLDGAAAAKILTLEFQDTLFPTQFAALKDAFTRIRSEFAPDLIFTQYREDRHQDHRTLSDLTWNAFRDHAILEYEIPKFDGDLGQPNVFVDLPEETARRKIELLMDCFGTQRGKHWFSPDTFEGLLRLRGLESATRFAEGFHGRKLRVL